MLVGLTSWPQTLKAQVELAAHVSKFSVTISLRPPALPGSIPRPATALTSRALHGKVARRDRHRDGGFYPDLDGDATLDTSTPQTLSRVKARSAIGFARPPRAEGASSAGSSPHAGTPTYSRARTAAPVEGGSFLQRRRKCVDALGYIPTLVSCLCSPPPRHRPAPGFGFHSCAPLIPHPVGRLGSGP